MPEERRLSLIKRIDKDHINTTLLDGMTGARLFTAFVGDNVFTEKLGDALVNQGYDVGMRSPEFHEYDHIAVSYHGHRKAWEWLIRQKARPELDAQTYYMVASSEWYQCLYDYGCKPENILGYFFLANAKKSVGLIWWCAKRGYQLTVKPQYTDETYKLYEAQFTELFTRKKYTDQEFETLMQVPGFRALIAITVPQKHAELRAKEEAIATTYLYCYDYADKRRNDPKKNLTGMDTNVRDWKHEPRLNALILAYVKGSKVPTGH